MIVKGNCLALTEEKESLYVSQWHATLSTDKG